MWFGRGVVVVASRFIHSHRPLPSVAADDGIGTLLRHCGLVGSRGGGDLFCVHQGREEDPRLVSAAWNSALSSFARIHPLPKMFSQPTMEPLIKGPFRRLVY